MSIYRICQTVLCRLLPAKSLLGVLLLTKELIPKIFEENFKIRYWSSTVVRVSLGVPLVLSSGAPKNIWRKADDKVEDKVEDRATYVASRGKRVNCIL